MCNCFIKKILFMEEAKTFALKLRTVYQDPIIVLKTENRHEFEVIIVSIKCEKHSIIAILPEYFPNVVHSM